MKRLHRIRSGKHRRSRVVNAGLARADANVAAVTAVDGIVAGGIGVVSAVGAIRGTTRCGSGLRRAEPGLDRLMMRLWI